MMLFIEVFVLVKWMRYVRNIAYDVLLVDDIQFLEKKMLVKLNFFTHLMNFIRNTKQIVITSDKFQRHPKY